MTLKRVLCASTMAAGIGVAGLFGMGLSTASADPGQQCNAPGRPPCGQDQHGQDQHGQDQHDQDQHGQDQHGNQGPGDNRGPGNNNNWNGPGGPGPVDWNHRGIDQGRQDHQPFNWNGQQVYPVPAGDGHGWGFWFLGLWIPL